MTDDTADPTTEATANDASDDDSEPLDIPAGDGNGDASDDQSPDDSGGQSTVEASDGGSSGPNADRIVYYTQLAAFAVLSLLALVATFRFYFAASNAVSRWVSSDFVSAFQAVFNLVVLLLSVIGLSLLVRRMRSG